MSTSASVAELAQAMVRDQPELRRGQAFFNALYRLDPELANHLCTTAVDPYYQDDRIPYFCIAIDCAALGGGQ